MINVAITVQEKNGTKKPTPTIQVDATEWDEHVARDVFAVLCERAGAIAGLLQARIRSLGSDRVELMVATDTAVAKTEPLSVSPTVFEAAGFPLDTDFRLPVRPYRSCSVDILDLHFPVFSGRRIGDDRLEPSSPYIYGTAFPIWYGGLFVSAAHVVRAAMEAGELVLGRFGGHGAIPGFGVDEVEIFDEFDLALLKVPGLDRFPPMPLEMVNPLKIFDPVKALGYPFSVDPEHLVAVHRGFAGHVVACRQLFSLHGQPFGYELSFQTPPGMSGAPLTHHGSDGVDRCYGFVVQQMDTEFAGVHIRLGLAVSLQVLRHIKSNFLRSETVSAWFGVSPVAPMPRRQPRAGHDQHSASQPEPKDWPDDDLPE